MDNLPREEALAKNIIIFSDGTGQDGGVHAEQRMSNIYKMYRACRVSPETTIDPKDQVAYYDPGLGTETTATGMIGLVRWAQKTLPGGRVAPFRCCAAVDDRGGS